LRSFHHRGSNPAAYEPTQKAELSDEVKNFLVMRLGSANGLSSEAMSPINAGFGNLLSLSGNAGGRMAGDSSSNPGDSTFLPYDSTIWENPWQTCATYTEFINSDGSYTSITDYGDGCWEGQDPWKYFMQGKLTSTYNNILDSSEVAGSISYSFKSEFNNYGGRYHYGDHQHSWLMNGYSNYEGESEYRCLSGNL
jgi:hypothetical protein